MQIAFREAMFPSSSATYGSIVLTTRRRSAGVDAKKGAWTFHEGALKRANLYTVGVYLHSAYQSICALRA